MPELLQAATALISRDLLVPMPPPALNRIRLRRILGQVMDLDPMAPPLPIRPHRLAVRRPGVIADHMNLLVTPPALPQLFQVGFAQKGRHSAALEALFPAGDGACAPEEHGGNEGPSVALGQQEDEGGTPAQGRVGGSTVVVQKRLALRGLKADRIGQGLAPRCFGGCCYRNPRTKPLSLSSAAI